MTNLPTCQWSAQSHAAVPKIAIATATPSIPSYCTRGCLTPADCPLNSVCSLNAASERVCTWGDYESMREPSKSMNTVCTLPRPADYSAACSDPSQCTTGICVSRGVRGACSYRCNANSDCPSPQVCSELTGRWVDGGLLAFGVCSVP